MTDVPCALCQKPLGDSIRSGYTPYATHADKRICVENIRADERERIANEGLSWVAEREREKIARAMYEAVADRFVVDGTQYIAVPDAAQIARNGG